jgi:hypothetical protein
MMGHAPRVIDNGKHSTQLITLKKSYKAGLRLQREWAYRWQISFIRVKSKSLCNIKISLLCAALKGRHNNLKSTTGPQISDKGQGVNALV